MNTFDIQSNLRKIHPSLQYNVYAANRLPIHVQTPAYLISNLDPDTQPGSHWIAIHIDSHGVGEYFDTYGRSPTGYHRMFLNRNSKQWNFSNHRIQNEWTSVCGEYCLMYLLYKFNKQRLMEFTNQFSSNTLNNDMLLYMMFKSYF